MSPWSARLDQSHRRFREYNDSEFGFFCIAVPVADLGNLREVYVASVWFNSRELSRDARCSWSGLEGRFTRLFVRSRGRCYWLVQWSAYSILFCKSNARDPSST